MVTNGKTPSDVVDNENLAEAQGFAERAEAEVFQEIPAYQFLEWISPSNWLPMVLAWAEDWLVSRRLLFLLVGTPYLILLVILTTWVLNLGAARNEAVSYYERALQLAEERSDAAMQEVSLKAIAGLRSGDVIRRLRLVELYWQTNRRQQAWDLALDLAARGEYGVPEAHLWIVRNALSDEPFQKLPDGQIEEHLRAALAGNPRLAEANLLLGIRYAERREWQLAEKHLQTAAELNPDYLIPLIRFRESTGRTEGNAETLQQALRAATDKQEQNPNDPVARIELGQVLLMSGKVKEAVQLIEAGRKQQDHPEYRRALAVLKLREAEFLLQQTTLNRDQCVPLIVEAINLEPLSPQAILLADTLEQLGVQLPPDIVAESLKTWTDVFSKNANDSTVRITLSALLRLTGDTSKAADLLIPLIDTQPGVRGRLVKLLVMSKRLNEAGSLTENAVSLAASDNASLQSRQIAAECLISIGDFQRARDLLEAGIAGVPRDPVGAKLYGVSFLFEFDALTGRPPRQYLGPDRWLPVIAPGMDTRKLLQLLVQAAGIAAVRADATDRLVRLILSNADVSAEAEVRLMELQAGGLSVAEVLNQMGSHALLHEQYRKGFQWLDRANTLKNGQDPVILNNLALAVLRGQLESPDRALSLINEALTMLPGNPELLSTRGEILIAMQDWNAALQDLERSLQLRPRRPKVHRLLEQVWMGLNNPARAAEQQRLAEALENNPL